MKTTIELLTFFKPYIVKIEVVLAITFTLYFLYNRFANKPFLFLNFWDSLYDSIWKLAIISIILILLPLCYNPASEVFFIGSIIILFEFVIFGLMMINQDKANVSNYCNSRFIENFIVVSIIALFAAVLIALKLQK